MDKYIRKLMDEMPESTLHDEAQNIMDEPIPEEVKSRLLKPLRKPRPSPAPRPIIKARERKRNTIVREFEQNFPSKALRTTADYQQEILDEPIPEEVKKAIAEALTSTKASVYPSTTSYHKNE